MEFNGLGEGISSLSEIDYENNADLRYAVSINFHGNSIQSLQGLPVLPLLQELILSSNLIKSCNLPQLGSLISLETLDLSANKISSIRGLPTLPKLKNLYLSFNWITNTEGIHDIVPNVSTIDLRCNKISQYDAVADLMKLGNLEELQLGGSQPNPLCNRASHLARLFTSRSLRLVDGKPREHWDALEDIEAAEMAEGPVLLEERGIKLGTKGGDKTHGHTSQLDMHKETRSDEDQHHSSITPKFDKLASMYLRAKLQMRQVKQIPHDTDIEDGQSSSRQTAAIVTIPQVKVDRDDVVDDNIEIQEMTSNVTMKSGDENEGIDHKVTIKYSERAEDEELVRPPSESSLHPVETNAQIVHTSKDFPDGSAADVVASGAEENVKSFVDSLSYVFERFSFQKRQYMSMKLAFLLWERKRLTAEMTERKESERQIAGSHDGSCDDKSETIDSVKKALSDNTSLWESRMAAELSRQREELLVDSERRLESERTKADVAENRIRKLESLSALSRRECDSLQAENLRLQRQVTELVSRENEREAEVQREREIRMKIEADHAEKMATATGLHSRVDALEQEKDTLSSSNFELQKRLSDTEKKNAELIEIQSDLTEKCTRLSKENDDKNRNSDESMQRLLIAETNNQQLQKELESARETISALQQGLSSEKEANESFQRRLLSAHNAFEEATTKLHSVNEKYDILESKKSSYKMTIHEMKELVQRLRTALTRVSEDKRAIDVRAQELEIQVRQAQEQLRELKIQGNQPVRRAREGHHNEDSDVGDDDCGGKGHYKGASETRCYSDCAKCDSLQRIIDNLIQSQRASYDTQISQLSTLIEQSSVSLPSIKHIDQSVDGVQLSIGGDSSKAEIDQATDARDTFQNRFSLNLEERKELESLRNRLARLESATMGNADDFARATTKVAELENAQKEHTTAMKVKDAILHDQGELIADLRRKLGQYERDNDALVKDVEHCEHQLREAEADIADLNDQLLAKKEIEEQLRSLLLEVQTVDYHIGSGDSLDRSIQLRSVTGNSVGWTDQSLDAMKGKDTEFPPNSADSMNRTDSDIDMGTPREEIPSRSQNTPEKVSVKEVCSACAKHVEEVAATREQLRLATERAEKSAEEDTVLREQMNRIMSEKTSLTTKQETLQAQLEEMRLQYATAKEGSSRLKTDKKYLTKQCAQLEANLKARDAEAVRLQGVAEQLRAALILSSTYSLTSMSSKTPNSLQQEPHPTP